MTIEEFITKYKDCNVENLDETTQEKLLRFENEVITIERLVHLADEAARRTDVHIKKNTGVIEARSTAWGEVYDKMFADLLDAEETSYRFRRCKDHNTERDIVCIDPKTKKHCSTFDMEVKTALNNNKGSGYNNFYTHVTKDPEKSKKYKSYDEKDYYILVQLDRDEELGMTFTGSIWFGRLSENDWLEGDRQLKAHVRDTKCLKIK